YSRSASTSKPRRRPAYVTAVQRAAVPVFSIATLADAYRAGESVVLSIRLNERLGDSMRSAEPDAQGVLRRDPRNKGGGMSSVSGFQGLQRVCVHASLTALCLIAAAS